MKEWMLSDEQTKDWGLLTWAITILSILDTSIRLTIEKKEEVLHKMIACSINKVYRLDVNDEETRESFMYIMRNEQDISNGFELSFNSTRSKISKREYPFVTPPKVSMKK